MVLQSLSHTAHSAEPCFALVLGVQATALHLVDQFASLGIEARTFPESMKLSLSDLQRGIEEWSQEVKLGHSGSRLYLHPGIGLWAESPELADFCESLGIRWVGPSSRVIRAFGHSLNFLHSIQNLDVTHLVMSFDPITSRREMEKFVAGYRKYPLVLKSVKQLPGVGYRVFQDKDELNRTFDLWLEQLRAGLGSALVFPERYLEGSKSWSVPFVRFHSGTVHFLPPVDTTLQSGDQTLILSCPSHGLDSDLKAKIEAQVKILADHFGYVGVGAFEFLIDGDQVYLVRGQPRLDPGFRLWQEQIGVSALELQIAALETDELASAKVTLLSNRKSKNPEALLIRLLAEDPLRKIPQAGSLRRVKEPASGNFSGGAHGHFEWREHPKPGIEVPSMCSPHFEDQWLGQLLIYGNDRQSIFKAAHQAFSQVFAGGNLRTNLKFVVDLLSHPWVREGIIHTGFIDEEFIPVYRPNSETQHVLVGIAHASNRAQALEGSKEALFRVEDQLLDIKALQSEALNDKAKALSWQFQPEYFETPYGPGIMGELSGLGPAMAEPVWEDAWLVSLGPWNTLVRKKSTGSTSAAGAVLRSLVKGKVSSIRFRSGIPVPESETVAWVACRARMVAHFLPRNSKVTQWFFEPEDEVGFGSKLATVEKEPESSLMKVRKDL